MKHMKKILFSGTLLSLILVLSGCVSVDKDTGKPYGMVYEYLAVPTEHIINQIANWFNGNYGIAIILITIIVRVVIMPLAFSQSRKSLVQQEKMAAIKPQMDVIQAKLKKAGNQEEQVAINQEMMSLYRENDMSMFGGIGCLPILIQFPIFSALYWGIRSSETISAYTFLGINLGEKNVILGLVVGAIYLLQSYLMLLGVPEEQKKQMKMMVFMTPVMLGFISITSPAGIALYWLIGGIFAIIQMLIQNYYQKPKIKAMIAEEMRKNPPKQVVKPIIEAAEEEVAQQHKKNAGKDKERQNRNAGKQQHKK